MVAVPVVILPSVVRLLRGAAFTRPEVQGGQRRDQERHGSGLHVEPFHTLYLDTFGVALFAAAVIFLLRRGGFLLSLLERLFHTFDRFDGLALGIDGDLGTAFNGGFDLRSLPFRTVGIPAEEVHLVTLEVGLDPGVERLTLPVLDHALDVESLDIRPLGGIIHRFRPLVISLFGHGGFEDCPVNRERGLSFGGRSFLPSVFLGGLLAVNLLVLLGVAVAIQTVVGKGIVTFGRVDLDIGIPLITRAGGISFEQHLAAAVEIHLLAFREVGLLDAGTFFE